MIKRFDLYVQLHIVHRCSIFGTPYAVCRELIYKAHYTILQWNEAVIILKNYVEFFSKFSAKRFLFFRNAGVSAEFRY